MISPADVLRAPILIVDDQDANVSLLEQMLRDAGYLSITSTRDPYKVYELHHINRYSLILLDLEMPGMDGFQVMDGLKKIETDGYLPILAITALPGHKLRALKGGAKDFVSKPFELAELLIRVYNLLEVRLLQLGIKTIYKQLVTDDALLQKEISERKQIEEALHRTQAQMSVHAGQLEGLVAERTSQLAAANKQLEASVSYLRKANEEHQALFLESNIMRGQLSQLTRQIITAEEELRKEISRELHDQVVQTLIGINVELSALGNGTPVGVRGMKKKIVRTQRLVERSVVEVHRFARELRPAMLDDLGLIPALHAYGKRLTERKKLKIHMTAFAGVEALSSDRRTVLFRVAQEALNNVARHARATQVKMSISRISGAIRMEISDNGRSFLVEKTVSAINPKRLGLVGMKERMEMVGGKLTIKSIRGKGTTVRAEIPFIVNEIPA
jgi:two-component system, NarL family, sensor histidine kinase DegS